MTHELFGEVISRYSRADMLADGSLVDVSTMAKEAGFKFPVAITSAVWHGYISGTKKNRWDTSGRLWDALMMLMFQIRAGRGGQRVDYDVTFGRKRVALKAVITPGDTAAPVLTISLPQED
jgi:hypothetical protein